MNKRPVIGLTCYCNPETQNLALRETYTNAILRAGGLPILLPMVTDDEQIIGLLSVIDGLLLSGGGDVDPAKYGEALLPQCGTPDPRRDEFELKSIEAARKMQMPIFGICRGVQVLNVAYGGTLIQDIESAKGIMKEEHRQNEPYSDLKHEVALNEGSLIRRITGRDRIRTNSMHHQSIKQPGGSLVIEGMTADGIVEAVSDSVNPSVFGVQFHPEFFADQHAYAQSLFDYFVEQARCYHRTR